MSKSRKIDALPTKELFISMLVKDIPLSRAILDLVDNAVDGARKSRPNGNYKGLTVILRFNGDAFSIEDNCGGITLKEAQEYAFRFGRPTSAHSLKHSVGQFGIGMKRALFKLGSKFRVDSRTSNSRFSLEIDVDIWKKKKEWSFNLVDFDQKKYTTGIGTIISVSRLHGPIARELGNGEFESQLILETQAAHSESLLKGLEIRINDINLTAQSFFLKDGAGMHPAHKRHEIKYPGKPKILVRFYAGVGESLPKAAGWYIFCNGRMVLEANKEKITGWGDSSGEKIPRYHNQFAQFRGFAFFDCDDSSLLPWNTTKTGVDVDSELYKWARQQMVILGRPVIDFLNELKEDKEGDTRSSELEAVISKSDATPIEALSERDSFKAPASKSLRPKQVGIKYSVEFELFERVRRKLGVTDPRHVGEHTFDYYAEREID